MILVAGMPYSGTTMLVDVLESLGVNMHVGQDFDEKTGEDRSMFDLRNEDFALEAQKRSEDHELWGYKDPFAYKKENFKAHSDYKIIVILRDPIAMQERAGYKVFSESQVSPADLAFAYTWGFNNDALMLSYEKTMLFPERTMKKIAEFIGVEADEKKISELCELVQPEKGYRKVEQG